MFRWDMLSVAGIGGAVESSTTTKLLIVNVLCGHQQLSLAARQTGLRVGSLLLYYVMGEAVSGISFSIHYPTTSTHSGYHSTVANFVIILR